MGSRVISHPDAGVFRNPIAIDTYAGSIDAAPVDNAQLSSAALDAASESSGNGLGCVRGLRLAIGLEAATALCIYAVWHYWHLFR